ncbi:MAG TPA: lysine transporter LysE [Porphyromonadaceae bacterium]|nr:lysine transporter LysE [Porphyromonadaceae bacterium]
MEYLLYMLWRGLAVGVLVSAPMGPVGMLCIQRALHRGRRAGLYTGVGAAISDLLYCLITGFGLSFIEDFLKQNESIITLVGSAVLIAFGVYLLRSNPSKGLRTPQESRGSIYKNILTGFLFTVSNPLILFLIIGLFARFNFLAPELQYYHYLVGYAGILAGALAWWWLVTAFVDKVRTHFNLRSMWLVNRIIGGIILCFALAGIVTGIRDMVQ